MFMPQDSAFRHPLCEKCGLGLVIGSIILGPFVGSAAVIVLAIPIAAASGRSIEVVEEQLMPVGFAAPFVVFWFLVNRRNRRRIRETDQHDGESAKQLLYSSEDLARRIPKLLDQASVSAGLADKEYRENAFAPFWDAVEQVARHLDAFNKDVRQLSDCAQQYRALVRRHPDRFPSFRIRTEALPDPKGILADLQRLTRMGQTNFSFAIIWEQRKTREVLIAALTEEQAKTRGSIDRRAQEHGRMLDNIQRHRKPPL
jgi:hypothetical protein